MAKRNKKKNQEEEPKTENRRQRRMRARDRERNQRVTRIVGGALGVALLIVVIGFVYQFVVQPRSVLARVADETIITREFWEQTRLRQTELETQLNQLQLFSTQFGGGQDFFQNQIAQIQATLDSPISLGTQVVNEMIENEVIRQRAAEQGITVTDEEVDEFLREEIAARQGALTEAQATATSEAQAAATATAETFTPTPEPTAVAEEEATEEAVEQSSTDEGATDESATDESAEAPAADALPSPTAIPLLDEALYQTGLEERTAQLREIGISLNEYREILRTRLLREKMTETIGEEEVQPTEEQVLIRHILIRVDENAEAAASEAITDTVGADSADVDSADVDSADAVTATEEITGVEALTDTATLTSTETLTDTEALTDTDTLTDTETLTDTLTIEEPTPAEPPVGLTDAEALALTEELRQRILDGEDFATLAEEFSDDTGSAVNGGLLDWAGRGQYVPEFEEAAFSLPVGELSEPVRTQFGYHLLVVEERDEERPKDENQLLNERAQAFQTWLDQQLLEVEIQRPENLPAKLPSGL